MTTTIRSGPQIIPRPISGDFSKALGDRRLLNLVLEVVQTVDGKAMKQRAGVVPRFRPQMMLTLVTYCYAACLFGSQDIEFAILSDPLVRYICARTYPAWQEIRSFRRLNREVIRKCLSETFRRAWLILAGQPDLAPQSGSAWLGPELEQQLEYAVDGRLDTAALMDGVESD